MIKKQIVAGSGGFQYIDREIKLGPIVQYALKLTNKKRPKFCYIGTAAGDSATSIASFYNACSSYVTDPSHLQLFPWPNHKDVERYLLSQDIIWVAGGSAANLLAVWEAHGLFKIVRKAWEAGIVLSGVSAGSLCWGAAGTTDSYGPDLRPIVNAFSLLPYSSGVHYDSEEQRRPLFQKLIREGKMPAGYATDDGVSLHFIDTKLYKAIADTEGKSAYHVHRTEDGQVIEERLEPELLRYH